jgi:hypothetical protein
LPNTAVPDNAIIYGTTIQKNFHHTSEDLYYLRLVISLLQKGILALTWKGHSPINALIAEAVKALF